MKKKERFEFWKKVRDEIDQHIEKKHKKQKLYHLTQYTGTFNPTQYVVFENDEKMGYTQDQERVLKQALDFRMSGVGDASEIREELKKIRAY